MRNHRFGTLTFIALGALAPACGSPGAGSSLVVSPLGGWAGPVGSGSPGVELRCSKAGDVCCAPTSDLPVAHCEGGDVGCNVATGRCEPCGFPGQVCCDGPRSIFSGKSYLPNPLDPNPHDTCAQPATCDAQMVNGQWSGSRTCQACGETLGGACCAKDAILGVGRCGTDRATGVPLTCSDPLAGSAGTCVKCGQFGEPACVNVPGRPHCAAGAVEDEQGTCVPCGFPGEPACDTGCDPASAAYDSNLRLCVSAGGPDQLCLSNHTCAYQDLQCDGYNVCRQCGLPGQACCPGGGCAGKCVSSSSGDECYACGHDGEPCCDNAQCAAGLSCSGGACRVPSDGGGTPSPSEWKTCNGEPYTFATQQRQVLIRDGNGCVGTKVFIANSQEEAETCARHAYGDALVTEPLQDYTFAVTGPSGLCNPTSILNTDEKHGAECATHEVCVNCSVASGDCPK